MSKTLVLGAVALALSAGAALAQAPNWDVYPGYGYAPYGYGYAPMAPLTRFTATNPPKGSKLASSSPSSHSGNYVSPSDAELGLFLSHRLQ